MKGVFVVEKKLINKQKKYFFLRLFAKNILCVGSEIGRLPPQFGDAAKIATNILNSGFEYDSGKMLFNRFKSVVSYDTTEMPIYSMATVNNADKLALYDSLDADVLQSYMEYSLASLIYYCLKEGACSEQSSRMTAMDNSSKNAGMFLDCAQPYHHSMAKADLNKSEKLVTNHTN